MISLSMPSSFYITAPFEYEPELAYSGVNCRPVGLVWGDGAVDHVVCWTVLDRIDIHMEMPREPVQTLAARAYYRVLELSRIIADLAGSEQVLLPHLAEALQFRPRRVM